MLLLTLSIFVIHWSYYIIAWVEDVLDMEYLTERLFLQHLKSTNNVGFMATMLLTNQTYNEDMHKGDGGEL